MKIDIQKSELAKYAILIRNEQGQAIMVVQEIEDPENPYKTFMRILLNSNFKHSISNGIINLTKH